MAIDICSIEPHAIERGLSTRMVLLYGKPKSGKTTAACQFKKPLLCAFEKGYGLIHGVRPQDINSWSDMKLVLRQLKSDKAKEMYSTIIIDTVPIAYDACEKYICQANGVQKIADIPWGGGYSATKKEFANVLREITMLGYGLVLISHSKSHIEKDVNGGEFEVIGPDMPARCSEVCNGIVDIIGYIGSEFSSDGTSQRFLYTRETPRLFAGSRLKYLAPKIKFGYEELEKAINDAIDAQIEKDGAVVVDASPVTVSTKEELSYEKIRAEASEIWTRLTTSENAERNVEMAQRILKKAEMIFGRSIKLSEITEDQTELYNLLLLDMRDLANNM